MISREINKELRDLFDGLDKKNEIKNVVNESGENKISSLRDLKNFLNGKEMPVMSVPEGKIKGNEDYSMTLVVGVAPLGAKTKDEGRTFNVLVDIGDDKEDISVRLQGVYDSIDYKNFIGIAEVNPKSQFKSVYEIVEMCDYDRFYIAYRQNSLDLVGKRFRDVKYTFELVESVRSMEGTLGVYFDERRKKYMLRYNPKFILAITLEEWFVKKALYNDLESCYIYTLGFLLAHEMSHIIRHNTSSTIGNVEVDTISPEMNNIFQDSFINVSLGKMFDGLEGRWKRRDSNIYLESGVGRDFSVRSSMGNGGLKGFKDIGSFLGAIGNSIGKSMNIKDIKLDNYGGRGKDDVIRSLNGGPVFVKVFVPENSSNMRESSIGLTTIINGVLKSLIDGKVYSAYQGLTPEEKKEMKENKAVGALVGKKVRDKKTNKIGVVIRDDGGKLQIVCPDNPEIIDLIIKDIQENPEKYKSGEGVA